MVMDVLQMQDMVAHHLPGKLNVEADWLSRPPALGRLSELNIRQLNEAWTIESILPPPGGRTDTVGKEAHGVRRHLTDINRLMTGAKKASLPVAARDG